MSNCIVKIRKKSTGGYVEEHDGEIDDVDIYTKFNDRMARNFGMDMSWKQFCELFEIVRFYSLITKAARDE